MNDLSHTDDKHQKTFVRRVITVVVKYVATDAHVQKQVPDGWLTLLEHLLVWIVSTQHFDIRLVDGIVLFKAPIGPTHHLRCQTRHATPGSEAGTTMIHVDPAVAFQQGATHAGEYNEQRDQACINEQDQQGYHGVTFA